MRGLVFYPGGGHANHWSPSFVEFVVVLKKLVEIWKDLLLATGAYMILCMCGSDSNGDFQEGGGEDFEEAWVWRWIE